MGLKKLTPLVDAQTGAAAPVAGALRALCIQTADAAAAAAAAVAAAAAGAAAAGPPGGAHPPAQPAELEVVVRVDVSNELSWARQQLPRWAEAGLDRAAAALPGAAAAVRVDRAARLVVSIGAHWILSHLARVATDLALALRTRPDDPFSARLTLLGICDGLRLGTHGGSRGGGRPVPGLGGVTDSLLTRSRAPRRRAC